MPEEKNPSFRAVFDWGSLVVFFFYFLLHIFEHVRVLRVNTSRASSSNVAIFSVVVLVLCFLGVVLFFFWRSASLRADD